MLALVELVEQAAVVALVVALETVALLETLGQQAALAETVTTRMALVALVDRLVQAAARQESLYEAFQI